MESVKPVTRVVRVGADIGQRADYTAIVVTEEQDRGGIDHYVTRMIRRLPLGTSYPDVASRIVAVVRSLEARSRSQEVAHEGFRVETWVDATGVGLPLIDLIREQETNATAAIFTGSEQLTERPDNVVSIGKSYMVGRLSVLLEADRLHLPITDEARVLTRELADYQRSVNTRAHASFDGRSGTHDDLVCALGLSVGKGRTGGTWSGTWLPEVDEDDYRHPDYIPPWYRG